MGEMPTESERRRAMVWPWVAAAVLAVILVGLIWWAATRPITYAAPERARVTARAPAAAPAMPAMASFQRVQWRRTADMRTLQPDQVREIGSVQGYRAVVPMKAQAPYGEVWLRGSGNRCVRYEPAQETYRMAARLPYTATVQGRRWRKAGYPMRIDPARLKDSGNRLDDQRVMVSRQLRAPYREVWVSVGESMFQRYMAAAPARPPAGAAAKPGGARY